MARKTAKELRTQRFEARQAELDDARKNLINGLNWTSLDGSEKVEGIEYLARKDLLSALESTKGMLRATISNASRTEIAIDLRSTNEGHTWKSSVFVGVKDRAAIEVGEAIGWEVVNRTSGNLEWREHGVVARVVSFWDMFLASYKGDYAAMCREMSAYGDSPSGMLFDDGDAFDKATRCAIVLREAEAVRKSVCDAVDRNDDEALAAVFKGLYKRCVTFLVEGRFRVRSTSALSNWQAVVEGEMMGRVAERCQICLSFLC